MTDNQKIAYEWAKSHDYPSIAARYARELAGLVDDLQGAYDAMARDLAARTRQVRQLQGASAALRARQEQTPCSRCGYGGKHLDAPPCTTCPAHPKEQQPNAPLTLDELREMDEEPVWIKLFDPDEEFWVLRNEWVDARYPEPMILFHMRWYSHADYGKTWLAYRQKPEEDSSND